MPLAKSWNRPVKIWLKTERRLDSSPVSSDPTRTSIFETGVQEPDNVQHFDNAKVNPEAETLRQLQLPIQLMTSLLLTKLISPFGETYAFQTQLVFQEPKTEEEANVLFIDVGLPNNPKSFLSTPPPRPVQALANLGENVEEELITTPFALIKLYSVGRETIGSTITLMYSSRIFVQECKFLQARRAGRIAHLQAQDILAEAQKALDEPIKFPLVRITRQPEDVQFWHTVELFPKGPPPIEMPAETGPKHLGLIAFCIPYWIEELRYFRELAYILAALLVTLTDRKTCSGFANALNSSDVNKAIERWPALISEQGDFAGEIEKAITSFKVVYRKPTNTTDFAPKSSFMINQRRCWRFNVISPYFYHWHLFDTSKSVIDLLNRENHLTEDIKLSRERPSDRTTKSPVVAALLSDFIESGRNPY